MILQALNRYYEALADRGDIARPGWVKTKVSYALCIDEDGELKRVTPLFIENSGKKPTPRQFNLPVPVVRHGSGFTSNFICDNSGYLLGIDNKGNPERSAKCFEECKRFHHELLDHKESSVVKAVLRFLDKWRPEQAMAHPALQEDYKKIISGANLVFYVHGIYAQDDPVIKEAWQSYYSKAEGTLQQCLVTGKQDVIETTHPSIRNIGTKAESALVSFNAQAYCSYGSDYVRKEQYRNAPIGKSAAFAYTAALNYLLADREHVQKIGDATVVCWAEGAEPQYQGFSMAALFGAEPPAGLKDNDLYSAVKRLASGQACEELKLDPKRPFYILGLSPNATRLSVRFFYRDTFGQLMSNINQHYKNLKIVRPANQKFDTLPLWALLRETVRKPSDSKTYPAPNPVMAGATARAVFTGGLYPASLLNQVILRIRAEKEVTWGRAAIIKAYYQRLNEAQRTQCVMEGAMEEKLNQSCAYQPYVLGELFAVMEKIQIDSAGGAENLNRTIKDSYFTTAAATPNVIFKKIFPLSEYHMKKLKRDKPQFADYLDRMKAGLICKLSAPIPNRMSEDEMNCFYIGYYHQRQALYTKKEES